MTKKAKQAVFQVLLMDNDVTQDVEVQEGQDVDFYQVKEHLRNGGSVFITSRNEQKIAYPKSRSQQNYNRSRRTLGHLFRQRLRDS